MVNKALYDVLLSLDLNPFLFYFENVTKVDSNDKQRLVSDSLSSRSIFSIL